METLEEISIKIDELRAVLCCEEDSETVRQSLHGYLRLIMVRYALKTQQAMSGKMDFERAYKLADDHMKKIEVKEFNG